ncbi:tetratricopeptide repeat protein [Maribacter sp. SA7]|uniref:tetratricopeptide repeat protein n=1 Tax=Maribacter zhoushanensis TaxID=3030012 RepID=UPI0023ED39E7|nr:tetratricopeptide repeat protein [Maribacter zhoushanensis]MDF4203953.1 tetratricopeptide repeat protein [Maribacter zhoushanensis]
MKRYIVLLFIISSCNFSSKKEDVVKDDTEVEEKVLSGIDSMHIREYVEKSFQSPMHSLEHQQYLDSALTIVPESAWLWQQKAMPLYKARKYQLGKPFLDKAVEYAPEKYLDYSGFVRCIFSKDYIKSISEFMRAKKEFGDGYVMDHTYNFYIGLDYLQLNKFSKAKEFLLLSKEQQFRDFPNDPPQEACHYLDWYYLGIADFELGNYEEAIASFDMSLKVYDNFADALYFRGRSMTKLGDEEGAEWEKKAFENGDNTINEDNVIYEIYPYQLFHKLNASERPQ